MKTKIELRVGRNAPCPCGSGKKFKRCCFTSENLRAIAESGRLVSQSDFPADLPLEYVKGFVFYNDGNEARVEVHDDKVVFRRGTETVEQWYRDYAVGKVIELERFAWADVQAEVQ